MANRQQTHHTNQRTRLDTAGTVGRSHDDAYNRQKEDRRAAKPGGIVGRDVPDQSKEHNTEIAVEAGQHRNDKT